MNTRSHEWWYQGRDSNTGSTKIKALLVISFDLSESYDRIPETKNCEEMVVARGPLVGCHFASEFGASFFDVREREYSEQREQLNVASRS